MLINGEKYACEACVRGHRVSSCTHHDRKLLHVNKKGRPVSQCQHCRSLRKARSQHVKCECHDKAHAKEDCPHLKTESGLLALESVPTASPSAPKPAEPHTCCCGHGVRCNCALKKDPLDPVPEDFSQLIHPKEPHRHRISSLNNHDGKPTVFTNGHHKPVHKINDAHNHCGAPYRVPSRSHTVHGHREAAQRSTDSLPIMKPSVRPTESPLHASVTSAPREARKTKSEHNSPELGPTNPTADRLSKEFYIPPLSPTAYSYSPFDNQSPTFKPINQQELPLPENIPDHWFTTYDEAHTFDTPSTAAYSDTPPGDWTGLDLGGGCGHATPPYSIPASATTGTGNGNGAGLGSSHTPAYAASFEHLNFGTVPRMNSSSGDLSEVDDGTTLGRPSNLRTVSNASNDLSSPGDDFSDHHRLSSTSSIFGTPQANMLAGNLDNLDIDEYVKHTVAEQKRLDRQVAYQAQVQYGHATPPLSDVSQFQQSPQQTHQSPRQAQPSPPSQQADDSPQATVSSAGYVMPVNPYGTEHAFTVSEAQAYAHMTDENVMRMHQRSSPLARPSLSEDPMWSGTGDGPLAFQLDDPREDEDWVR